MLMKFLGFDEGDLCPKAIDCFKAKKRLCDVDGLQCGIKRDLQGNTIREMVVDWETGKYVAIDTCDKYI